MKINKILFFVLTFIPISLFAASSPNADLDKVVTYLNKINSYEAEFTQNDPEGGVTTGKFYLKRPGKLRVEYNPPMPRILVINKSRVTYYDIDIDQISYTTADKDLLSLLTRTSLNFTGDIELVKFDKTKENYNLRVKKRGEAFGPQLVLRFDVKSLILKELVFIDEGGLETRMVFKNIKENGPISKDLFYLHKNVPDYGG